MKHVLHKEKKIFLRYVRNLVKEVDFLYVYMAWLIRM